MCHRFHGIKSDEAFELKERQQLLGWNWCCYSFSRIALDVFFAVCTWYFFSLCAFCNSPAANAFLCVSSTALVFILLCFTLLLLLSFSFIGLLSKSFGSLLSHSRSLLILFIHFGPLYRSSSALTAFPLSSTLPRNKLIIFALSLSVCPISTYAVYTSQHALSVSIFFSLCHSMLV